MLEQFRKGIFETDGQGGEEWIWNIYNQIFRAVPRSPASESAAEGALAPGIMSEGFTLQPHSLTGTGRETEALPGAFLLPGVMVIGMILRFFRGKGKRRH